MGALVGLVIGLLVAKLGIPSFVVTLAFFLGLQGVTLKLIGLGGTIPVRDEVLRGITIKSMPVTTGWIVVIALLAIYGGLLFWRQSRLAAKDLHRPPNSLLIFKFVALCVILLGMTAFLSQNRSRVPTFVDRGHPLRRVPRRRAADLLDLRLRPHRLRPAHLRRSAATPRPPVGPASASTG